MVPLGYRPGPFSSYAKVRAEIRELLILLLEETERRGYRLHDGWCWAYACRGIKRPDGTMSDTPSNHSWGLALDLNAPANPNTSGPLVTDMPTWMPELWESYGFRWGGNYRKYGGSTVDAMHYEFMGSVADAARYTEKARQEIGGEVCAKCDALSEGVRAFLTDVEPTQEGEARAMYRALRRASERPKAGAHDHADKAPVDHVHPHSHTAVTKIS